MIFYIHGSDMVESREKAGELERRFFADQKSDLNILKLDGESLDFNTFIASVMALPFLGDKRLIIIKNLISANQDLELKKKIGSELSKVPSGNSIIFYESRSSDKRESLHKQLEKIAKTAVFDLPDSTALPAWIIKETEKNNFKINHQAAYTLALYVGSDPARLRQEIGKLVLYAQGCEKKEINVSDIEIMVEANNSFRIFDLTDAIADKDSGKALRVCESFKKAGEESGMIFNMVVSQFRKFLIIDDFGKKSAEKEIAEKTGIHPFVVKKSVISLRNFQEGELKRKYLLLRDYDWKIKSGALDMETALTMLLVLFCGK